MKLFGAIIIFFSLPFLACSSQPGKNQSGLIDSIKCTLAPDQMYAAFIPDSVENIEKLRPLFIFDPAARAKLAVEQYKELAQKYKVALFCSYNSKNGPLEDNKKAADAMFADAIKRFPIDESKILITGFSGGSRFSFYYATLNPNVVGVIACGAFFPGNEKISKPTFTYSGIAGTYDFNFKEALMMHNQLSMQNYPFQLITFNGNHDWPPTEYFERALCYQLLKSSDMQSLKYVCNSLEEKALKMSIDSGDFINVVWTFQNLIYIDKNREQELTDSLSRILTSKIFQQHSKLFNKSLVLEDSLDTEFSDALKGVLLTTYNQFDSHKSILWWKQKINMVSRMEENSKDVYKKNAAKRIKGQIGIMLWETNRRLMQEKYYDQSLELAEILIILNPESGTYYALKAETLAAQGKTEEAKSAFATAKIKGFTFDNAFLGKSTLLKQLEQ